ncbi:hypothetical protein HDV57DRAFT_91616 [Trichoderma longibrachiatum]
MAPLRGLCHVCSDLAMFTHCRIPSEISSTHVESRSVCFWVGKSQSSILATLVSETITNCLIYLFLINVTEAIECTSNRGSHPFTPSAVHEGLSVVQLACYSITLLRQLPPPETRSSSTPSLQGEEGCGLRPRALKPDSGTPHGLPLRASTHNARRCMHAWLEEDVIRWMRDRMLQGRRCGM